jgi:ribonuclease J
MNIFLKPIKYMPNKNTKNSIFFKLINNPPFMSIEVCAIGGFTKTEGNSIAIKIDDEVIVLDMGLSMENYIKHQEDREDVRAAMSYDELHKVSAVPNYDFINDWKDKVKAVVCSHGHLDHVGAVPFCAPLFPQATVISTPFAIEILKSILHDEHVDLPNRLVPLNLSSKYMISDNITIEFVHITHSIPHTAIIVLHTKYGKVMYVNDFKLDPQPVIGKKPDYKRLKELGDEGVDLLIMNSLYAHAQRKCPSESVAREMLKNVMLGINSEGRAMIVTTFSSHLARLKSIVQLGKELNRKVIFLGRSLDKYVTAGDKVGLVTYQKDIKIFRHRDKIEKILRKIQKEGKDKYLIVCTGHQGEPKAILSRLVRNELDFRFESGDIVIFSCQVIPVEVNIKNREKLDNALKKSGVRLFKDVHVSGHGALEDHRDMLEMVKPKNFIPVHTEPTKGRIVAKLAAQLGFKKNFIMTDGKRVKIN